MTAAQLKQRPCSPAAGSGVSFTDVRVAPHRGQTRLKLAVDSCPSVKRVRASWLRRSWRRGGTGFGARPDFPSNSRTVLKEVFTNQGQVFPVSFHRRSHLRVTGSPAFPEPTGVSGREYSSFTFFIASWRRHFARTDAARTSGYFSSDFASTRTSAPRLFRASR